MTDHKITLELHWPPSVNQSYMGDRQGKGRLVKKPGAKKWMADAVILLNYQKPYGWKPLEGRLALVVELCPPTAAGDIDNRLKASFDALEAAGIIGNDRQIRRLTVDFLEPKKPGFVRLAVHSLPDSLRR